MKIKFKQRKVRPIVSGDVCILEQECESKSTPMSLEKEL